MNPVKQESTETQGNVLLRSRVPPICLAPELRPSLPERPGRHPRACPQSEDGAHSLNLSMRRGPGAHAREPALSSVLLASQAGQERPIP